MASSRYLRLGTRGSRLAIIQAEMAKSLIQTANQNLDVEIVTIKTSGDQGHREVLGAFVREIEQALLDDRVDVALHCLKDLPTQPTAGLTFFAYLERDDSRDALISSGPDFMNLASGAVIGTGSPRRTAQLRSVRKDLVFKPLVGNVDTRLGKLRNGEYQAIVLALAGLNRLNVAKSWQTAYPDLNLIPFSLDFMLPAPGQAVLVVQGRESDSHVDTAVRTLDDGKTRRCATAEREFLKRFGGGCSVPVAAHCAAVDEHLYLRGLVSSPDGQRGISGTATGLDARKVGQELGDRLLTQGAAALFQEVAG